MGQAWWINAAGAALTVGLVFRLGRALHRPRTGGIAAALATTSPFVILLAGSLMAHTWAGVLATAFVWTYWQAYTTPRRSDGWAFAAGVLLGAAAAIRPYTALAVALPAALWAAYLLLRDRRWRPVWFLILGFAPLAALVPLANAVWTGDPVLSPYVMFWPYDRLGFGPGTGPMPEGNTVWLGLSGSFAAIGHLGTHLLGWPALSLVPAVLAFLFKPRLRRDIYLGLTALSLVFAYTLYWTSGSVFGPRYSYEVAGLLFVLSALGIERAAAWARSRRRRWPFVALVTMVGALIAVNLGVYLPRQIEAYRGLYGITAEPRRVLEQAGLHDALVIVEEERGWWDYAVAFSMNAPGLDGDVVYASDCAPHNDELIARYPDRTVYRFDGAHLAPYR
jgi:4-amino-4-deoxy-L-arabinose transferase-like glycosyltransferase